MKKQSENHPLDDLFARKLDNMSLQPGSDGFERLQARMQRVKPEIRIGFWQNSNVQRYMAIAATLLLVCLFTWLYWPVGSDSVGTQMATNRLSTVEETVEKQAEKIGDNSSSEEVQNRLPVEEKHGGQFANAKKSALENQERSSSAKVPPARSDKGILKLVPMPVNKQPVLAQTPSVNNNKANAPIAKDSVPAKPTIPEQLAESTTKTAPPAERVLIVTIAEPATLVAARQSAKIALEEKAVVAINTKPEKETKGLWEQVRRIKNGDVFARSEKPVNDERGLLSRAYNGIKQSFEKENKSEKQ